MAHNGRYAAPVWAAPALWLAAAGYSGWLLGYALPVNVGTVDGYVSELPASDQPYHAVFRAGDLGAGVAVFLVAGFILLGTRPADRRVRLAWWALAVFGVATIGDVIFPLDCAQSVSTACAAAEQDGTVSAAHHIHAVTSVIAYVAIILHMVFASWAERRRPGTWPVLGRRATPLTALTLAASLVVLALVPVGLWLGIPQRISVLCVAVWFVLLGGSLATTRRQRGAGVAPAPAGARQEAAAR